MFSIDSVRSNNDKRSIYFLRIMQSPFHKIKEEIFDMKKSIKANYYLRVVKYEPDQKCSPEVASTD